MNFAIAVKSFIVNEDNKLLIIKRDPTNIQKPGIWEVPGGRLNPGENPYGGLKREVKEETSLDVDIVKPINVRHFTRVDGQVITMLIFMCKPLTNNVKLSKEHTDFDWVDLKNPEKLAEFYNGEIELFKNERFN